MLGKPTCYLPQRNRRERERERERKGEGGRERFLARPFTEHQSHHTLLDPPHFALADVCKSDTW